MVRLARPAALVLVALTALMAGASLLSLAAPGTERIPERPQLLDFLSISAIMAAFSAVGFTVVAKRPRNPVGWLFLATGAAMAGATFCFEYVDRVIYTGAGFPVPVVAAWVGVWIWLVGPIVALPLAIVLFPEGRLPGSRWRGPVAIAFGVPVALIAATAVAPGPLLDYPQFENPVGLPVPVGDVAIALAGSPVLGVASFVVPGLFAIATTVVRMRRARGAERQQLKWLLYPFAMAVMGLVAASITQQQLAWSLSLVAFASLPVFAGIAILRYRLYDIDVVIRRTAVYAAVVGILGVVYVALVVGLQALLSDVTGGETLPVALSTLAIAALFGPVRARTRQVVDRRFYRSRYDAQRTLEAFAARVRDEVELDAVGTTLVTVAERAVAPRTVGLWLRAGGRR